jgi:hypothetical protein
MASFNAYHTFWITTKSWLGTEESGLSAFGLGEALRTPLGIGNMV